MVDDLVPYAVSLFLRAAAGLVEKTKGNPDKFYIAAKLKRFAAGVDAGAFDGEFDQMQLTYERQMEICVDHNFICLEYYRRNANSVKSRKEDGG